MKTEFIASGYCDTAVRDNRTLREIMDHLEVVLGDEVTLLQRGDHAEIVMVYEDSRPNQLIYKLPRGYK